MPSGHRLAACAVSALVLAAGCKHALENRAIKAFSTALAEADLDDLRKSTSPAFAEKALRSEDAVDDLAILDLPTGDTSIVEVEEVSETERNVTVQVGDTRQKLLYELVKDEDSGRWVVDDVLTRQRRRGHTDTRSVTDLADLLISVREFVDAWTEGDRNDVLATSAPELRGVLAGLPPAYLAGLTKQVAGDEPEKKVSKPKAQLDGDRALVELNRTSGDLKLVYLQTEEGWQVTDLALESGRSEDQVPSLLKRATALGTAIRFLDAYGAGDKKALAEVTTPEFFGRGLRAADLSSVPLPRPELASDTYDLVMQAHRADFIVPRDDELVKVALVRQNEEDARGLPPVYRVEETVLYEADGKQEKPLSAMFTAQASMLVFCEALRERNLPILRKTATTDFNRRVWDRLVDVGLAEFPLDEVSQAPPRITSTVFQGAVTEITVTQGPRAMTYVLRTRNADLLVDDVLVAAEKKPASLKSVWELRVPVHLFASGVASGDVPIVQRSVSDDFNRLVWSQARRIPRPAVEAPAFLAGPITAVAVQGNSTIARLGTDRRGAVVSFVEERGYFAIDDVLLVAGPEPRERVELKGRLRTAIAERVDGDTLAAARGVPRSPSVEDTPIGAAPSEAVDARVRAATTPVRRSSFAAPVDLTPELGEMPIE